ncbi:hypothetical protein CBOM_02656 [Ceraceosorus bombacis]|uniref:DUF1688-domain-containing protein n=1 Tax=Ceraceosorus bombacis TaxID=401625 RepID=A0A0P1BF61_9BASI|nr:hypothetical protein CBOM_02656 [Ceraceosorus bombacis]
MSSDDVKTYLRSLPAIRERCASVFKLAEQGKLDWFDYQPDKLPHVVRYCTSIVERDYPNIDSIPPHGRWRHFGEGRIAAVRSQWNARAHHANTRTDSLEEARSLVDLFIVSVLLDAGAGAAWTFNEPDTGERIGRSEGLAIASLHLFKAGLFGDASSVRAQALQRITPEQLAQGMQVSPSNPMDGLQGRAGLLKNLGDTLASDQHGIFAGAGGGGGGGADDASHRRPGYLIDYLASHPSTTRDEHDEVQIQLSTLWHALIVGLAPVWPTEGRMHLKGESLGDAWSCHALARELNIDQTDPACVVPFHKLTQWLCYSIVEPLEKVLGWQVIGKEAQTGLPEYRNGGLLIDLGVLVPRPALYQAGSCELKGEGGGGGGIPTLKPSHQAVIEWRSLTVVLLDRIADGIRHQLGLSSSQLRLAQVLESATWKGGREIAKQKRDGAPPITIDSDGTIF